MRKKIIILTDTLSANGLLQNSLLNMDYEIMVSKDILTQPKDKEFYFLQNFDLIIYQQSMYSGLKESFLDNLALLNKPIVVLTFESEQVNKSKYLNNANVIFVRYPISVTDLASKLAAIFEERASQTGTDGQEKMADSYLNNEGFSRSSSSLPNTAKVKKQYSFQLKDRTLIIDNWLIPLTKKEHQVLEHFIESDQRVFSSQALCEAIWTNAKQKNKQALLSNLINRIKQKIMEKTSIFEPFILNKKGIGYYLNQEFVELDEQQDEKIRELLVGNV
ncbi:helix-turn-helix domain-containing protein [Candidatus Enterococcus ikei]|uniref:Winged helix-turn-helix domain-containing protein n=1 Tax=Candidatus Enterococcus ikei TaxID=2815326 RepID=A0ABS3H526_9ENTE|nr:helix-turn-helix domain-containing protein [Enterococcus sp. DIV0869a]MBO0441804.1 winged helix-turn-helix domain-containing protein [Enterococcus sp. DIV0869a]